MGCRAAAALARQLSDESEEAVRGVVCLSFPLHPPGQTHAHRQRGDDLRALPKHLSVLFVSGTEDTMCDRVRMVGFPNAAILITSSCSLRLRDFNMYFNIYSKIFLMYVVFFKFCFVLF